MRLYLKTWEKKMSNDVMTDAIIAGGSAVDGKITGMTKDHLSNLKSLWRAEWEKEGEEPVGFVVPDYMDIMKIRGCTAMRPAKDDQDDLPLFTRPTTQAELDRIRAEYLERVADTFDFTGSVSSPAARKLRNTAKQLRGE
jgi:hypothetical protein